MLLEEEGIVLDSASFPDDPNNNDQGFENFFADLLPAVPRRAGDAPSRADVLLDLIGSNGLEGSVRDLLYSMELSHFRRDTGGNSSLTDTLGMNLFRLLEGRRPQGGAGLRMDSRELLSLRGLNGLRGDERGDGDDILRTSIDSALSMRRQPARHSLLASVDNERTRLRSSAAGDTRDRDQPPHPLQRQNASSSLLLAHSLQPGSPEEDALAVFTTPRQQPILQAAPEPASALMGVDSGLQMSAQSQTALGQLLSSLLQQLTISAEPTMDLNLQTNTGLDHAFADDTSFQVDQSRVNESLPPPTDSDHSIHLSQLPSEPSSLELPQLEPMTLRDSDPSMDEPSSVSVEESESTSGINPMANVSEESAVRNTEEIHFNLDEIQRSLDLLTEGVAAVSPEEERLDVIEGDRLDESTALIGTERSSEEQVALESIATVPAAEAEDSRPYICPEGYEAEVFYSLPLELQAEIAGQVEEVPTETPDQTRALIEAAGFDFETINSLPENIRMEILDQARRDQEIARRDSAVDEATAAPSSDQDNAAFLMSLSPELRAEVLLTADPAFLGTLPPELVAEASNQREHAAARWQQREMVRGVPEFDEEEEEEDQPRRAQTAVPRSRLLRQDGRLHLPADDVENTFIPDSLITVFSNAILEINLPLSLNFHRLLYNISKNPFQRDLMLRVLTALMVGDDMLARRALGDAQSSRLKTCGGNSKNVAATPSSYRPFSKFSNSQSGERTHQVTIQRIVGAFRKLVTTNISAVYDFLRDRAMKGGAVIDPLALVSMEGEDQGSNSLLDMVITMFSHDFCNDASNLLDLAVFVELLCAPLDGISSLSSERNESNASESVLVNSVDVPRVRLSRSALTSLTDLLLNDACSKIAYKHMKSIMSRLAKVAGNRVLMLELLSEVITQLADALQERLRGLYTALTSAEQRGLIDEKSSRSTQEHRLGVVNAIPMGEVGIRQHESFHQALLILLSLIDEQEIKGSSLLSAESVLYVWEMLDKVLLELMKYTDAKEEPASLRKPQSILTSMLTRLLPTIESFFLVHSHDLLYHEEGMKSDLLNSTHGSLSEDLKEEQLKTPVQLQRMNSVPGSVHRQTPEYRRLNISVAEDRGDDHRLLRRTRSTHSASYSGAGHQVSRTQRLAGFVQLHASALNLLIRSNPSLLEGSFSVMVRVVSLRTHLLFENKRVYFFNQLSKRASAIGRGRRGIHIQVRRDQIFEDSYHQLRDRSRDDLRGRLQVSFHGEEGIDAGGLTREWYLTLSREIFNPNYALFSPVDAATFQPNPLSVINSNHLDYFKFVGRVIGKAITDGHLMDAHFTRYCFYPSHSLIEQSF